ncbi:MAG: hypothetical protein Q8M94_09030 [Ignavibacteria bacterium]|nr:hypothetical protein [Ignavibacteria bacterium]
MKKYKNLQLAFLIEILIGFGTILSISLVGPKGIAALAMLALRPFVLDKENIQDQESYFQFSYKVLSNSLSIIFIMIFSIIIILQFIPIWKAKLPPVEVMFIVLIPFFLLTHGVIGLINYSSFDQKK